MSARQLRSSILDHPCWPVLRPFMVVELYGRDTSRVRTRFRLDVTRPTDGRVLRELLGISMPCVICGLVIHPVRMRQGGRRAFYYAATCPLDVSVQCARQRIVSVEYLRVRAAVELWQRAQTPPPPPRPARSAREPRLPF